MTKTSKNHKAKANWAVCINVFPSEIGYIMREECGCLVVMYSEKQQYPWQWWDKNYVERFPTLAKAVKYYVEHTSYDRGVKHLLKETSQEFPHTLKKHA